MLMALPSPNPVKKRRALTCESVISDPYVRAYMWFSLAAAQSDKDAENDRPWVELAMPPAQLANPILDYRQLRNWF